MERRVSGVWVRGMGCGVRGVGVTFQEMRIEGKGVWDLGCRVRFRV